MTRWEETHALIAPIMDHARSCDGAEGALLDFLELLFQHAAPEDLKAKDPASHVALGRYLWQLTETRPPDTPVVQVFNPVSDLHGWSSPHTAVAIVNDDMPFLMDSVTGYLGVTRKLRLHEVFHPIVRIRRNAEGRRTSDVRATDASLSPKPTSDQESIIYVEIDAQSDDAVITQLRDELLDVLADVRTAVRDWRAMVAKIDETVAGLTVCPPPISDDMVAETIAFLRWLSADNFTFLGYRDYRFHGDPVSGDFTPEAGSGRGLLRDPNRLILRGRHGLAEVSEEIRHFLSIPDQPVIITKANVKSKVHRPVHMDYIGVKIFDEDARVVGERRFVGLFTSLAYATAATDTPLLRRKVLNVQRRACFDRKSHAGKTLTHILETFPRDELFQIDEDQLHSTAMGILYLLERPRPRAFIRRDRFGRFVSVLVYVPRDSYHTGLREKVSNILCKAFKGTVSVYYAQLSDEVLARWHFIIRTQPDDETARPDELRINEQIIEAVKGWEERLRELLIEQNGEERGNRLMSRWVGCFSAGYREDFQPHRAVKDIDRLEVLATGKPVEFAIYRRIDDPEATVRLKIYSAEGIMALSRCLPMLEHAGFSVISENAHMLSGDKPYCIHDFALEWPGDSIDLAKVTPLLETLFYEVWTGKAEDDRFNGLGIPTGLLPKQIALVRAYVRYLRQLGLPYGFNSLARMLVLNAGIVLRLVHLFDAKFNPDHADGQARDNAVQSIEWEVTKHLDDVDSLDHDRVLRGMLAAIKATLRTNFYSEFGQLFEDGLETALALKIRTGEIPEAPRPRPWAEIFVHSKRVEGVHLRGGPVARGGLRWSDRPEDFRTEVLGLVKAQQVKNAVIVPVGAKGGFVPRHAPTRDRSQRLAEGIACYKIFINTLLSVTDNLDGGEVVPPPRVVRLDADDPYLVVAADKGTATFSDISNGLALKRGFWLGDAFASGGSQGYDHKKMGITARGAWVSVQRHFRELGLDVQSDPITVIGIGDMSGDVFGNGMLLSRTIRLKAAFNHLHIFLDPAPDPESSFAERQRLFDLPGSTWDDYDRSLLSSGGGIFARSAKAIPISDEVRAWLGLDAHRLTPDQLIHRILQADADLMWFGGIGTYAKATDESHVEAGDRANDPIRVDARQLRVKAVAEGGNLGMTQRARIEFAQRGGRLNTDFIDNSAGVDCSDKEVNIKIALKEAVARGRIDGPGRDTLLAEMTEAVAEIVLEDNYLQTQAISIAEMQAAEMRELHAGLMRTLEREGSLDRELEFLPSDERLADLALSRKGLSRPELAVLTAYAKMSLQAILANSPVMDDANLHAELQAVFPERLRRDYSEELDAHRLRREIIATVTANQVVNRGGLTFIYEVREETGLGVEQIVAAFVAAREAACLPSLWHQIDALDLKVSAEVQTRMHIRLIEFLKHQTVWFLRNAPKPFQIGDLVGTYGEGLQHLLDSPEAVLSPILLEAFGEKVGRLEHAGVPTPLARRVAALTVFGVAADVVAAAHDLSREVADVGKAYFEVGDRLGFDWLRQAAETVDIDDHWDRLAARAVLEDLADQQRELTRDILASAPEAAAHDAIEAWVSEHEMTLVRTDRLQGDLRASGLLSVAKLSFAVRHLRSILSRARAGS